MNFWDCFLYFYLSSLKLFPQEKNSFFAICIWRFIYWIGDKFVMICELKGLLNHSIYFDLFLLDLLIMFYFQFSISYILQKIFILSWKNGISLSANRFFIQLILLIGKTQRELLCDLKFFIKHILKLFLPSLILIFFGLIWDLFLTI